MARTGTKQATRTEQWYRRLDLVYRQVGFDLVLLDFKRDLVFILNPTAAALWHSINPGRDVNQIADGLMLTHNIVEPDEQKAVIEDAKYLLAILREEGLLIAKKPSETIAMGVPEKVTLPDREFHPFSGGYSRPSLKKFSVDEVNRLSKIKDAVAYRFSDTWEPPPDLNEQISVRLGIR